MPLVGIVDPSHNERAEDEPGRLPSWLTVDEVLERAAGADPSWSPWPYELLKASMDAWQERDYLSSSMFSGCARGTVIERREDFILSVDDLYAALRGTQIHRTLELAARPNSVAEWRFWTTLTIPGLREPVEMSCSPDIVTWEPNALGDFKTTAKDAPHYPWKTHTRQVQFNAYIVRHAEKWVDADGWQGVDIPFDPHTWNADHLYLVYLAPNGPQTLEVMKTREVKSPKGSLVKRRMPYVWSDEEVEKEMFPRVKAMAQALASYPEWPFGDEYADEDGKKVGATGFGGKPGWSCPGKPWCSLPNCMAKRHPGGLVWAK